MLLDDPENGGTGPEIRTVYEYPVNANTGPVFSGQRRRPSSSSPLLSTSGSSLQQVIDGVRHIAISQQCRQRGPLRQLVAFEHARQYLGGDLSRSPVKFGVAGNADGNHVGNPVEVVVSIFALPLG